MRKNNLYIFSFQENGQDIISPSQRKTHVTDIFEIVQERQIKISKSINSVASLS